MIRFLPVLLCICLILAPGQAFAETNAPIGTVVEVEGSATVTRSGITGTPAVDGPVYSGDIFETGPSSKVLILFEDETEFTLSENARLGIDEYIYDPDYKKNNKARYSVLRGAFLYASGLIAKEDPPGIGIETPYGSIGIRGTTVWGGPDNGEYGIFVQDGEVTVTNNRARVRVGSGQGVSLRGRNAMPGEVKQWGADKIARATQTVALRRHEAARERVQAIRQQHRARIEQRRHNLQQKRPELQDFPAEEKKKLIQEHKKQIQENMQQKKESGQPYGQKKEKVKQQRKNKQEIRRKNND